MNIFLCILKTDIVWDLQKLGIVVENKICAFKLDFRNQFHWKNVLPKTLYSYKHCFMKWFPFNMDLTFQCWLFDSWLCLIHFFEWLIIDDWIYELKAHVILILLVYFWAKDSSCFQVDLKFVMQRQTLLNCTPELFQ